MEIEIGSLIESDNEAMQLAISEAKKGLGWVAPNPPVGCVILGQNRRLLAKGYHRRAGGAHAEIEALSQVAARSQLKGAHVFVTLEPCCHHGRTPPCTDALLGLNLGALTYGQTDPNPKVAGGGISRLRESGLLVKQIDSGLIEDLAELTEVFFHNIQTSRAFIAMKVASTLDGQISHISGKSQWITGPQAREHTQYLRGLYDAVIIGVNTLINDNPRLNSRAPEFKDKVNKVVILDPRLRSLEQLKTANLLNVRSTEHILLVTNRGISSQSPFPILEIPDRNDQFDLPELSRALFERGICSAFVEGGGITFGSFLASGEVKRLYCFLGPSILGSSQGISWSQGLAGFPFDQRPRLEQLKVKRLGEDTLIEGVVAGFKARGSHP